MKNAVFWDVAPCRSCVNRRFRGTYRLHLQGGKIRKQETSVSRCLQTEPHGKSIERRGVRSVKMGEQVAESRPEPV
jgi:hypothetical protein